MEPNTTTEKNFGSETTAKINGTTNASDNGTVNTAPKTNMNKNNKFRYRNPKSSTNIAGTTNVARNAINNNSITVASATNNTKPAVSNTPAVKKQKVLYEIGNSTLVEVKKENKPVEPKTQTRRKPAQRSVFDKSLTAPVLTQNILPETKSLKVVFLGGVGEIGKNMTALEYGNDIIIVDAGMTFPNNEMLGIDVVVPDITYLIANRAKIRGIVVTHGHEDHIGGLPYLLGDISAPIYGSRLALALIENKMGEHKSIKYTANSVKAGDKIKLGCFTVEFINVNHSIAGSFALSISTPVGQVVHSGDFKIDFSPINGKTTDLNRLGEIGNKGVRLLLCESTNVERAGYSMSESTVGVALDKLFEQYKEKRLIIATFASNIHRLQQIMDLAIKYGRKIVFTGRSMLNVSETAMKIGELTFDKKQLVDIDKISKYKDSELCVITTGSQGEPMSALTRMANNEFPKLIIGANDCVIISASPIPGNEASVNKVINLLYKKDATVIYHELADVHVSGHACQEELKTMHSLVKPQFFMPVHGEFRHLKIHGNLAESMGMEKRNIILPDLGNVIEITPTAIRKLCDVTSGERLVDGLGMGETDSNVLRDRKKMSEDGVVVVVLSTDASGQITKIPEFYTRGFIYFEEQSEVLNQTRHQLYDHLTTKIEIKTMERMDIRNEVRRFLNNLFKKKLKRVPLVITII